MYVVLDHREIRGVIWDRFPEVRPVILNLEADDSFCTHYTWVSEAFWWPVFEPALREDRRDTLTKCFALTDDMLGGDEQLQEVTQIRVAEHLLAWPDAVRSMGGPLLIALLVRSYDWPTPPGEGLAMS